MRAVIIGNGTICDYDYIKSKLCSDDYIICADGGLKHIEKLLKSAQMGMQGKAKLFKYVAERGKELLPIYYHYQFNSNSKEELALMWPILEYCMTEKYIYPKLY